MDDSSFLDVALTMSELSVPDDPHLPHDTFMTEPQESLLMSHTSGKTPFLVRPFPKDEPSGSMVNGGLDDDLLVAACKPNGVTSSSTVTRAPNSTIPPRNGGRTSPVESVESSFPSHSVILPSATPNKAIVSSHHCPMITHVNDTVKRYNFMVAGQSGAGKSSFCYSTFRRHFDNFTMKPPEGPTAEMGECGRGETRLGNERIIVTVVDTFGHGDELCVTPYFDPVLDYIETQYVNYDQDQLYMPHKSLAEDTRIHCLFYFFAPHRVTKTDIAFLRQLQSNVSIVPIVSKADSLTFWELAEQLQSIRTRLTKEGIALFDFQETDVDEGWLDQDFDRSAMTRLGCALEGPTQECDRRDASASPLQEARPTIRNVFAVISGERHYAWGAASEDCRHHSDTTRLQTVLFRSLGRLTEHTNVIHQEWRTRQKEQPQQQQEQPQDPQVPKPTAWNVLWESHFGFEMVVGAAILATLVCIVKDYRKILFVVETCFFLNVRTTAVLVGILLCAMLRCARYCCWAAKHRMPQGGSE
jgi:septin family protein